MARYILLLFLSQPQRFMYRINYIMEKHTGWFIRIYIPIVPLGFYTVFSECKFKRHLDKMFKESVKSITQRKGPYLLAYW